MRRITGLIDGSLYAESVCDHIAWLAGRGDVAVELLHVIGRRNLSSEPANLSGSIGLGARTALLEELASLDAKKARLAQKRGRMLLDEARLRLQKAGVSSIETKLRNGDLLDTILEHEAESDLIVIGKRGEGAGFARQHLGSNLERVVRATHKPIVVASKTYRPVNKVLIAYDGEAMAMKAVEAVSRSGFLSGLAFKLVMAGDDTPAARKKIDEATTTLQAAGNSVQSEIVSGQSDKVIANAVETGGFDLLVMGAYSHSRLRNLFIGSTTTEMLRSCRVSVAIFR